MQTEASNNKEYYMHQALYLAREAADAGEVPVGCVIAGPDGVIIGRGRNRREERNLSTAHAEIEAIEEACRALGDWRLDGCSMYVTLEPCPMCAGAIINSRISEVVYAAGDDSMGSCGSVLDLFYEAFGHRPVCVRGICSKESEELMKGFFRKLR